jgi:hypothetical protein
MPMTSVFAPELTVREDDMGTTASAEAGFGNRVQAVLAEQPNSGVIDRFAANDLLLDLLDAAQDPADEARVLGALADLPKSGLIDRFALNNILRGLCQN